MNYLKASYGRLVTDTRKLATRPCANGEAELQMTFEKFYIMD